MNTIKLALVQMNVSADKKQNNICAEEMIAKAASQGHEIVCLPEMWNTPYSNKSFPVYAEADGGETCQLMARWAQNHNIWLVGGSIPERDGEKLYNTAFVYSPEGECVGKHRKMHLFDIDIKDGIRFMESEALSAGDQVTVFDTPKGKIGLAICFDMRFPELMRLMTDQGAVAIVVPAAFNMITGPAHWHLTARMRAVDNQVFFACVSPARDENGRYVAYGHSLIVDPWGKIVAEAETEQTIVTAELDLEQVRSLREELPLLKARRKDLYQLTQV